TLCYEMADDFVDLFKGYREKTGPLKKMQMNALVAQNVKRIRLAHKMSMASLAAETGLPEFWVARMERGLENSPLDQLQQLSVALKVETATVFAPSSNKVASADAKARAPK